MGLTKDTVLKAWRDESFRESLSEQERAAIPPKPSGDGGRELSDAELDQAAGGIIPLAAVGVAAAVGGSIAGGFGAGVALENATD